MRGPYRALPTDQDAELALIAARDVEQARTRHARRAKRAIVALVVSVVALCALGEHSYAGGRPTHAFRQRETAIVGGARAIGDLARYQRGEWGLPDDGDIVVQEIHW